MAFTRFSPITTEPTSSQFELTRTRSADESSHPHSPGTIALGKPQSKAYFSTIDLLVVLLSLACLTIAVCVVTPRLTLSWSLGFDQQIVVIGFLMSIMAMCMKSIAPNLFMILEAKWGDSRLQNYDAIARNTMVASWVSLRWRTVILLLLSLPLGLSAAYKRFIGGTSTAVISTTGKHYIQVTNSSGGYYGLVSAPLNQGITMNTAIAHMITANAPFQQASAEDADLPPLPQAFGYNTLLLDDTSAALLDMPVPDYVTSIQQSLGKNEVWTLSAKVNATVTRYNVTGNASYIQNDNFWKDAFKYSDGNQYTLSSWQLFNGWDIGYLQGNVSKSDGTYCLLGIYPQIHTLDVSGYTDADGPDAKAFRQYALMFNTRREECFGSWNITTNNITLVEGSCSSRLTNQTTFGAADALPYPIDAMAGTIGALMKYTPPNNSPWRIPSFTASVATIYWARLVQMFPYNQTRMTSVQDLYYLPTNQTITSTKETLHADWALYLVLCLQPVLTVLMFVWAMAYHSSPVQKSLGLVAILAGVDRESLDIVHGAALSGELALPVTVGISVQKTIDDDSLAVEGEDIELLRYTLGRRVRGDATLVKGKRYG
jgi:hypothetical protein